MNGELAQIAALAAHARAALITGERFSLDLSNSTFKFVHDVTFDQELRRFLRKPVHQPVGANPADWYNHLVRSHTRSVVLMPRPSGGALADHIASAFAGGGGWAIQTVQSGPRRVWQASWRAANPQAQDRRIWSVLYREFETNGSPTVGASVSACRDALATTLTSAERFAREAKLDGWRDWFEVARHKLDSELATSEYHPDILPVTMYSNEARRLLAACERAWVFGGMGSWNDLGFKEPDLQRGYDIVTPKLYSAVLEGICAAVNDGHG